MTTLLRQRDLNRALLARQLLLRREARPVAEVVELGRMLTEREVVRLKLMRGTVHLVTVRDALLLRPLVQIVIERGHNGAFGRRMGGASAEVLAATVRGLLDGGALTGRELARARARDRRRRRGARQRDQHVRAAGAAPAARRLGRGRAGALRDARGVDRPRAGCRAVDRRGRAPVPALVRPGVGDGRAELVGADEAQAGARAAAPAARHVRRRTRPRAVRPARRAASGRRRPGAGAAARRVRQRTARPRRSHPHHPRRLPVGRDAGPRPLRQQPLVDGVLRATWWIDRDTAALAIRPHGELRDGEREEVEAEARAMAAFAGAGDVRFEPPAGIRPG